MKTLKILNGLLIIIVLYLVLVQAEGEPKIEDPQTIRAKSFEFVDDNGVVRASLHAEPDGETIFRLRDSKGEIRVKLGGGQNGSGLVLINGKTEPGIHALAKTDQTSITLTGASGNEKVLEP